MVEQSRATSQLRRRCTVQQQTYPPVGIGVVIAEGIPQPLDRMSDLRRVPVVDQQTGRHDTHDAVSCSNLQGGRVWSPDD